MLVKYSTIVCLFTNVITSMDIDCCNKKRTSQHQFININI